MIGWSSSADEKRFYAPVSNEKLLHFIFLPLLVDDAIELAESGCSGETDPVDVVGVFKSPARRVRYLLIRFARDLITFDIVHKILKKSILNIYIIT